MLIPGANNTVSPISDDRYIVHFIFVGGHEVCEQTFSWLSRYARSTKYMNKEHLLFSIIYICDLHNRRILNRIK